ncbi:cupredoxin domain-containing protein [Ornithinimicrobium sp. Arc0846-15]|nr:cupredoxin domain-containing protein [Ornithinimicrobium laminariae]
MRFLTPLANLSTGPTGTSARRFGSSAAAGFLAVALVAGCGGDAEEQASPTGAAGETTSPSEPAATDTAPRSSAPEDGEAAPADAGAATQAPADEPEDSSEDAAVEEVVITISDFAFDVPETVAPGTEVTIRNEDRVGHTVTSDEEGLFDTLVAGGTEETFIVPEEPGEYSFYCRPHPNMIDTLVIG